MLYRPYIHIHLNITSGSTLSKPPTFSTNLSVDSKNPLDKLTKTPPRTSMEPEKERLEEEIPFGRHHFQVPAVSFQGSTFNNDVTGFI